MALWFFRNLSASPRLIGSSGVALALAMACPGRAEAAPRSRAEIALSFATVVRAAAPAVVNVYTRKQQHRSAANPFTSDPFFRFFFPEFGSGPSPRWNARAAGSRW